MAEFIESNRGKCLLIFENYKFSKANTKFDGTTRWKCINRKCAAILYTNQTNTICSEKTPRDTKNVERQRRNEAYIEDYKNYKICRYKFVKQISYNYKK